MVVLAPSVDAIKEIHAHFIRQYGVSGYMSEGMIEGCIERAMTYVYDFKPFPRIFLKAAAILESIIIFHPFVDGNKRTAFETTRIFLRLNGYEIIVPTEEGIQFTRAIANLKVTKIETIVEWIRKHTKRRISYLFNSLITQYLLLTYYRTSPERRQTAAEKVLVLVRAIDIYID